VKINGDQLVLFRYAESAFINSLPIIQLVVEAEGLNIVSIKSHYFTHH